MSEIRASIERTDGRAATTAAIALVDIPRHTDESQAYRAAEASGVLIAEREYFDGSVLRAVRTAGELLTEAEQLKLLEALESLRRDNLDMVRQAGQAAQGLKEQAVVLDRTRVRQMMTEIRRGPAFAPCAGKFKTLAGYEP